MALHMVRNIKATRIFKGMPQTVIIQVDRFKGRQFDTTAKERQLGTPLKVLVRSKETWFHDVYNLDTT